MRYDLHKGLDVVSTYAFWVHLTQNVVKLYNYIHFVLRAVRILLTEESVSYTHLSVRVSVY